VDQYGRLLRYVFVRSLDGQFVNAELLRQGLAQANQYPPDVACNQTLQAAEDQARAAQLGLWAPAPASRAGQPGEVEIVTIFFNGSGEKEPDEYVEIRSAALAPIQLEGWTLVDKAKHRFTFPDFLLQPGQVCRIYTDQVHPEWCGFSFSYNETAIWNNGGDCAILADSQGAPVTEYCYSK
jgi:micrococcal nuclease